MLNIFSKPVEIQIDDQTLQFCSTADFEFCLSGRTSVPATKMIEMVNLSADDLKKEAKTIKEIGKRFVHILSRSYESPGYINRALREIDIVIFSQDHNWRSIISALHEGDEVLDEFRRIALVKYMQYLSARQEIIKHLYNQKKVEAEPGKLMIGDVSDGSDFKETVIFEKTMITGSDTTRNSENLERMPKGECVSVYLNEDKSIMINLSKHHFKLKGGDPVSFVDDKGIQHQLKRGKNSIGRDSQCTIPISGAQRDISRLHLIVENDSNNLLHLTDMSAHGTFLPAHFLRNHSF